MRKASLSVSARFDEIIMGHFAVITINNPLIDCLVTC
jgi:hypothetical protein